MRDLDYRFCLKHFSPSLLIRELEIVEGERGEVDLEYCRKPYVITLVFTDLKKQVFGCSLQITILTPKVQTQREGSE